MSWLDDAEAELHQFVSQWISKNHLSRKEAVKALRIQSKLVARTADVLEATQEPKRLEYQK